MGWKGEDMQMEGFLIDMAVFIHVHFGFAVPDTGKVKERVLWEKHKSLKSHEYDILPTELIWKEYWREMSHSFGMGSLRTVGIVLVISAFSLLCHCRRYRIR